MLPATNYLPPKKIAFFDVVIVILSVTIIGFLIFLFITLRTYFTDVRPATPTGVSPAPKELGYISVNTFSATVNEVRGNSIFFTPDTLFLSYFNAKNPGKFIFEATVDSKTKVIKVFPKLSFVPSDTVRGNKTVPANISSIQPKDSVTIQTDTDLKDYRQGPISAKTITINILPTFFSGTIQSIQENSFDILSPIEIKNPTAEDLKNTKLLHVLFTPETEFSFLVATGSAKKISIMDLKAKDYVNISTDNLPQNDTLTADTVQLYIIQEPH